MRRILVICTMLLVALGARAQQPSNSTHQRASLPPAPPPAAELLERPTRAQPSKRFHPRVVLKDAQADPVLISGQAIDTHATCGACHDVAWIAAHGLHFKAKQPSVLLPTAAGPAAAAPNCFFCHVRHANVSAAASTLASGATAWVSSATLLDAGLVVRAVASGAPSGFTYVGDAFAPDGSVSADQLQLGPPANTACGACHGLVSERPPELSEWLRHPHATELTGQVFSPTRVSDSPMNIKDRERSRRTWDVHAERLVLCSDCHFSPNDPRARALSQKASDNLRFEPRHASISAFLQRPDHELSHGSNGVRCESCHEAQRLHGFLPHRERHLAQVSCEACHIPSALGPALQELDFALPVAPGQPNRTYRGLAGDLNDPGAYVDGFNPALVQRGSGAAKPRLYPVNFVTTWAWRERSAQGPVVPRELVERAFFDGSGSYRPEMVAVLDRDGNHVLEPSELVLDSRAHVEQVRRILEAAGASSPQLIGDVKAHPLHHGIVAGRFALRDCAACHGAATRLNQQTPLSARVAPGAVLTFAGEPGDWTITLTEGNGQGLRRVSASVSHRAIYVFGTSRERAVDVAGAGIALLTLLGALGHAGLRLKSRLQHKRGRA